MAASTALPPTLKSLQHYMKIAAEHDKRNAIVAYYARMYVAQRGIKIDTKSPNARSFLIGLMDSLETTKKSHVATEEAFKDDIVARAIIEKYVLKLFSYADAEDRAERFNNNVIKAFYTAGMLMDILTLFSELSDEVQHKRKYAKWKAAHIHACLKNGEKPHAGPVGWEGEDEEEGATGGEDDRGAVGFSAPPSNDPSSYNPPNSSSNPSNDAYSSTNAYPHNQPNNSWPAPNYSSNASQVAPPSIDPTSAPSASSGGRVSPTLTAAELAQAQKLMKYAYSALNFVDVSTAVDNLKKALSLLTYDE